MKRRRALIALLVLIIFLLVLIIIFLNRNNERDDSNVNDFQTNKGTVYNQGQSVLKYQDYIFLIDELANSIIRYDIQDNVSHLVAATQGYKFDDTMYIVNNKLVYSNNNVTYYSDADKLSRSKFTDGRIVYINDDIYIYILQEEDLQYLYITSYDNTNFRKTNELFYNLAKGYQINYLKESGGLLFFTSINSDQSITLFTVDLKNSEVTLIARETSYASDTSRGEIVEAVRHGNDIYYIVAEYQKMTNGESLAGYDLMIRPIDAAFSEFVNSDIEPHLFVVDDELYLGKYDSETSKYSWKTTFSEVPLDNWIDKIHGDISKYFKFKNSKLYFNEEELITLNNVYLDYTIAKVVYCDDAVYVLLEKDSSYVWISCKMDGSEFTNIYEVR